MQNSFPHKHNSRRPTVLSSVCVKNITSRCFSLILKFFGGHKSFLLCHRYDCFRLLVMSAMGFKARVNSLSCVLHHLHATDFSHSPLVSHLLTSWWPTWPLKCFIHVLAYRHQWGWSPGSSILLRHSMC